MATQAWPAAGCTIAVDQTGTGTYTLINEVKSIKGAGGGSIGTADTTWLSSAVKTYRATIKDPGDLEIDLNFDPTDAVHKFLRNLGDTPLSLQYKVVFATGATTSSMVTFGLVTDFKGIDAGDVEENLQASFTIKMSGAPTWVAAT